MTPVPPGQKIYHITHVDNLPAIIAVGELRSDARMIKSGGPAAMIGMHHIKERRLYKLPIDCLGGVMVGECVPFYFCPRSVMLYIINKGSADISYRGGQAPIVHLEADLDEVLAWACAKDQAWAFSLTSAATFYAKFRANRSELDEIDWAAVQTRQWSGPGVPSEVKDRKQAEFLVADTFPWSLVRTIGVRTASRVQEVTRMLDDAGGAARPLVEFRPAWYY